MWNGQDFPLIFWVLFWQIGLVLLTWDKCLHCIGPWSDNAHTYCNSVVINSFKQAVPFPIVSAQDPDIVGIGAFWHVDDGSNQNRYVIFQGLSKNATLNEIKEWLQKTKKPLHAAFLNILSSLGVVTHFCGQLLGASKCIGCHYFAGPCATSLGAWKFQLLQLNGDTKLKLKTAGFCRRSYKKQFWCKIFLNKQTKFLNTMVETIGGLQGSAFILPHYW